MCGVRRSAVETKVAFRAIREPSHHAWLARKLRGDCRTIALGGAKF